MGMLISGLVMLLAVVVMLRVARPNPDGSPVRFLARDSVGTAYALVVTAFIGVGVSLTIAGANALVAVASAYVH